MRALTAQQLLTVWESGQSQMPAGRAMALLAAAHPAGSTASLAGLSIGQRDAQLLRLREWAFGSHLLAVADCPQCRERVEVSFSVDDITASGDVEHSEPLSLHVDGYEISFRLPDSADLIAVSGGGDVDAIKGMLIQRCVLKTRYQGSDTTTLQLPENVVEAISAKMASADPQADVQLALDCPGCGTQWEVAFDIVSFFWSEIGAWAKRVLYDVHILASAYGWREADILAMSPLRRDFYLEMLGA